LRIIPSLLFNSIFCSKRSSLLRTRFTAVVRELRAWFTAAVRELRAWFTAVVRELRAWFTAADRLSVINGRYSSPPY